MLALPFHATVRDGATQAIGESWGATSCPEEGARCGNDGLSEDSQIASGCQGSREVDVVLQPGVSSSREQAEQVSALGMARTPTNQHDKARKRLGSLYGILRQGHKVGPIAAHDESVVLHGMTEHLVVRGGDRQCLAK